MFYYARLAFFSGASTAFICHSGEAQPSPDFSFASDAGSGKNITYNATNAYHYAPSTIAYTGKEAANYRYISKLTTGPSYKYNITQFVTTVLPADKVLYTDKDAMQLNSSAMDLADYSDALAEQAKEIRIEARSAKTRWQAVALCKKADSLDVACVKKQYESTETFINAGESQFEANSIVIKLWQKKTNYNSDALTTATLLNNEATYYYTRSITEMQESDTSSRSYIKQAFLDEAQKDMETAVLKQQSAENVFISINQGNSITVAKKIDSILSVPAPFKQEAPQETPTTIQVMYCVQIDAYFDKK